MAFTDLYSSNKMSGIDSLVYWPLKLANYCPALFIIARISGPLASPLSDCSLTESGHHYILVKGILWDRRWIVPSVGIFSPHMRIFFTEMHLHMKLKQSSKFLSDPSPNCFTIDVWHNRRQQFISYLSYCFVVSHFTAFYTSSVVFWDVIFWE